MALTVAEFQQAEPSDAPPDSRMEKSGDVLQVSLWRENRRVKLLRVHKRHGPVVVGTSRYADIRIPDSKVEDYALVLERTSRGWWARRLTGEHDRLDLPISEHEEIMLGDIRLELEVKGSSGNLFSTAKELSTGNPDDSHTAWQVAVIYPSGRREVHSFSSSKAQTFTVSGRDVSISPPTSMSWERQTLDSGVTLLSRQLRLPKKARGLSFGLDRDLKRAGAIGLAVAAILVLSVVLMPEPKKAQQALDQKSLDIIYNSEAIKAKKQNSDKARRSARKESEKPATGASAPAAAANPNQQSATGGRLAGLKDRLMRMTSKAQIFAANGAHLPTAKTAALRDTSLLAPVSVGGQNAAAAAAGGFKVGSVSTIGGGTGSGVAGALRGESRLSGSGVGHGTVTAPDDETLLLDGGLDREVIAEVIRSHIGEVRHCYERELSANPGLTGKLLMKFAINGQGSVIQSQVAESSLHSPLIEGCVSQRLSSWRFPKPKGGTVVRVSYPFMFKPI